MKLSAWVDNELHTALVRIAQSEGRSVFNLLRMNIGPARWIEEVKELRAEVERLRARIVELELVNARLAIYALEQKADTE